MKKISIMFVILVLFSCNKNDKNILSEKPNSDVNNFMDETNIEFQDKNKNVVIVQSTIGSKELLNQTVYNGDINELEKLIMIWQLCDFSKNDLRILRNTIYAKYGYIFNSNELKEHFSKFSWYNGIFTNVDDKLTIVDTENLELIQKVEQNYPDENDSNNELIGDWYMYGAVPSEGMDSITLLIERNDHVQILPNGIYVHYCRVHLQSEEIFYGLWFLENNIFETITIGNNRKHDFPPNYGKTDLWIYKFDFNDGSIYPGCHLFGDNGGGWVKY
jgi:hypothetical protein